MKLRIAEVAATVQPEITSNFRIIAVTGTSDPVPTISVCWGKVPNPA